MMSSVNCIFYVWNRGGDDLIAKKKKSTDIATVFARSEAKAFCKRFTWPKQKGFGYNTCGGIASANVLAREMARRGHWHCSLYFESDCDPSFRFLEEHRCPEDIEFLDWQASQDLFGNEWDEAVHMRALFPSEPVD